MLPVGFHLHIGRNVTFSDSIQNPHGDILSNLNFSKLTIAPNSSIPFSFCMQLLVYVQPNATPQMPPRRDCIETCFVVISILMIVLTCFWALAETADAISRFSLPPLPKQMLGWSILTYYDARMIPGPSQKPVTKDWWSPFLLAPLSVSNTTESHSTNLFWG